MTARRSGVLAALVSMVAAGSFVGGSVPAGAVSTSQSYWVPVDKKINVRGHGYGHGHGMSQYGAQGAASSGKTYREIVDFYYPGTAWDTMRGPVRVLVTADTTSDVMVSPKPSLAVRDLGDRTKHELPAIDGVKRWRLNVDDEGRTVVGYLTDRWHKFEPGGKEALVGDGEFLARGAITLWTPSGSRAYRGRLRAATPPGSPADRDTVNVLAMDQYVKGVVPHEMPASWHPEAVKAQSVAARTYATWSRNQNRRRYYQICDTTSCQVYGGKSAEDPRSNAAVRATKREVLTYQGKPAFTQFSASSGGWTSAGSMPYLPAQKDPYDGWDGNPFHDWSITIDAGQFERSYPSLGTLRRILVVNRDGNGDWQGRVHTVVLDGTKDDVTISGDDFRWAFGLRSNWFTIDPTPIMARYDSLGGSRSELGDVRSREYPTGTGAAQRFDRGRIFYSKRTGAHELYGPVLRAFRRSGGPGAELGFPRTGVQEVGSGVQARFQHGAIFSNEATGTVPVLGRHARRYLRYGGVKSDLGWPTQTNTKAPRGERVEFQRGYLIRYDRTGKVRVRVYD